MSDKYAVPNKLPAKQVSILAHRKKRRNEEDSHKKVKQLNRAFKLRKKPRGFIKAEVFVNQYRKAERDAHRMRRLIAAKTLFKVTDAESNKLLVVFRHRAHKIASDVTNKMLNSLCLGQLFNAALLKNNEETSALLKLVEPYVTWGYPSINTVRELIFKHGFLRIDKKKVAIDSNKLIEDNLGHLGVICIEDIVHEMFNATENFDKIKKFLVPFKLKPPKGGWERKTGVSFAKGGEYGNRKAAINELIAKCL
ncbi:60S ribosomal protein L7 [Pseudolycoriella hygida]|uniref:60S ribosomal protein L7 n=1 Tax=Pseudolycoriella hygida TaxID=35572 RepID=A0A9Q0SA41_9DIPT|nr:60S ribosomal protein L7 [Pseudolycoriella hygida]